MKNDNHPSAVFSGEQRKRGCFGDVDSGLMYLNFDASRDLYINKEHNRLQDINNRYQTYEDSDSDGDIPQFYQPLRLPLKEISTNHMRSEQNRRCREETEEIKIKKVSRGELEKVINPNKLFNKMFESDKDFQNKLNPLNLDSKNKVKLDDSKNETNPY
jgi:hypothetical protein